MTRTMSQLGDSTEKAKLAAALMFSMPGVPFVYYGEEIGLTGVKPDDPNVRRPMQWDASPSAGFTGGTPWIELGNPAVGADVATQDVDPASLLNFYRTLIHLRQATPALRAGDTWLVKGSQPAVFSLLRFSGGEAILLVTNLTSQPLSNYQLDLVEGPLQGQLQATLLEGNILSPSASQPGAPTVNDSGGFNAYTPLQEIPPYGMALIRLK
jgi:glycosidase